MKLLWIGCAAMTIVFVASVVPGPYASAKQAVDTTPLLQSARLDQEATATLDRACGNCHSNRTDWPWYGRVAPASWLLRKDVSEGRKFLNFSRWPEYGAAGQGQLIDLAGARIKAGTMPPRRYLLLHPEARLSDQERSSLVAALAHESARLSK
jgi:hypothetical protein